ncbi:hypothetical protein ACWEVD_14275 [Nocardia thailandica]|uniref:Secreted protein n=1 Tax=Nocardia thailandica TaxID=257275 RepID=A0ABW6PJF9_9NOCA|nr:hypothetical protein [Nocardia thailandica]
MTKKLAAATALSCALLAAPATASAAPVDAIAGSGSGQGGGSGSSETQLICSPVAQLLFATGSVEKPALYDLLCLFS